MGWSREREDEKEDFNLLGFLAPERWPKCWSWWEKEGRAQGEKSGWCLWRVVIPTLRFMVGPLVYTFTGMMCKRAFTLLSVLVFSSAIILSFFFFLSLSLILVKMLTLLCCLFGGKLLEEVQNAGSGPSEEQPEMPV